MKYILQYKFIEHSIIHSMNYILLCFLGLRGFHDTLVSSVRETIFIPES